MKRLILFLAIVTASHAGAERGRPMVLTFDALERYVARFNALDEEIHPQAVTNAEAFDFLKRNIPLLSCPDESIERTYYRSKFGKGKGLTVLADGKTIAQSPHLGRVLEGSE